MQEMTTLGAAFCSCCCTSHEGPAPPLRPHWRKIFPSCCHTLHQGPPFVKPLWGKFLFILPHPSSRTASLFSPGLPDVQSGLKRSGWGGGGGTGLQPQGRDFFSHVLGIDFFSLFYEKKSELSRERDKLRNGLSKIDDTREKVQKMSVELEDAKKQVVEFQKQCDEYLLVLVQQKQEADEQQKV